jgi:prepilin-type N-terminal cleavage/methylation domain-containing protein
MRAAPRRGEAGFTLIELLIASVLLLVALGLAAQLFMESAEQLVDATGEQADPTVPLLLDRLRADVLASSGYGTCEADRLLLTGHPAGQVLYQRIGGQLHRAVLDPSGTLLGDGIPWRGVSAWSCQPLGAHLVRLDLQYEIHRVRRTLNPSLPGERGPATEVRNETLFLAPRGGGLGESW